jgi:muramoyltetrapeptide carboxypeptidase
LSYSLHRGDLIGVIAPAGPVDPQRLALVPALYEAQGWRARIYPGCAERCDYLAGDDDTRLADLHAALADPEVAAIHCIRGGYGSMRILDRIDAGLVRRAAKLLIGYSDITALHALWAQQGLASLHAPMPASDLLQSGREADRDAFFGLLRDGLVAGQPLAPTLDATAASLCRPGVAEGPLIGGNLSLVAALLGTPWAWDARGAILFLEDINEEPYRVDRLLTQLRLAGVLEVAAGFVLGSFTEEASPMGLLQEMLGSLGKPVLAGWPSGHGTPNRPLPMGLKVQLKVQAGSLTLLQDFLRTGPSTSLPTGPGSLQPAK